MEKPESRSRVLALSGVFVLTTIGMAIWVGVTVRRDTPAGTDSKPYHADDAYLASEIDNVPNTRTTAAVLPIAPRDPSARASLSLHVFDAVDHKPVLDAVCVVYSHGGGYKLHGLLHTDADGRASLSGLPEDLILVHVARRPPHASAYAAVSMEAGDPESLEIPLTVGGVIVGRVIDDKHAPIAGARVTLDSEQIWIPGAGEPRSEPVTSTGSDGRFEIANAVSVPVDVSLVDGKLRAGQWFPEQVHIRVGVSEAQAEARVEEGARVDVGDIVLKASIHCSGRVVDAQHVPVEGALVEVKRNDVDLLHMSQVTRTALEATKPDQAITGKDGKFRVETGIPIPCITVTTKSGAFEQFTPAGIAKGREDLELVLQDWSILELEFVDENGTRITGTSAVIRSHQIRIAADQKRLAASFGQIDATLVFDGGPQLHALFPADADGLFRFQTTGTEGLTRRLHVELPGFLTVDEMIGAQDGPIERKRFTLQPEPVIRVHVSIAAQPKMTKRNQKVVFVHACMIDPAKYSSAGFPGSHCCGLGATWWAELVAGEHDVEIPVMSTGTFWLHTAVPTSGLNAAGKPEFRMACVQCVGPCIPGGEPIEIKVPTFEAPPLTNDDHKPPPPSGPMTQSLRMRILDGITKAAPEDAFVDCNLVPENRSGQQFLRLEKDGNVRDALLRPGVYDLAVKARGYRSRDVIRVTITEGKAVDLGTIELDPLPDVTLHVLESDGHPVPADTYVELWKAGSEDRVAVAESTTDNDGSFTVRLDTSARFTAIVYELRTSADVQGLHGQQWLQCDFQLTAKSAELHLQPWHPIEIRVAGAVQEFPAATVEVSLAGPMENPKRHISASLIELLATQDGIRRFRAEVGGPGRVRASLRAMSVQQGTQDLDVSDRSELQTFTLTSSR